VLLVGLAVAAEARGQIVNGSFEQEATFSFEGWSMSLHPVAVPLAEAPAGGGIWALKLYMRNQQALDMNVAYQVVDEVRSGDIWRATAWARIPPERVPALSRHARMYWTDFRPGLDTTLFPYFPGPVGDWPEARSVEWALLTAVDTLLLGPGDSSAVVLDAGLSGGPGFPWDWAGYDLVSAERIGTVGAEPPAEPPALALSAWPSPFGTSAEARLTIPEPARARLALYDVLGREVARYIEDQLAPGEHRVRIEGSTLRPGVYLLRLTAGTDVVTRSVVRVE
jgi:hypothetical protein